PRRWGQLTWGRAASVPASRPGDSDGGLRYGRRPVGFRSLVLGFLLLACGRPAAVPSAPQATPSATPLPADPDLKPRLQPQTIEDGHARPRAIAVGRDGLVYVAATTANVVYVVDADEARVRGQIPVGRFPDSLLALEDGRVAVVPRYSPEIDLIDRTG